MYSNISEIPQDKSWLEEIIDEATMSIRQEIINKVKHHSRIWEIPLVDSWRRLYNDYTTQTGHVLQKSKVAKIDQVANAGQLDVLLRLARHLSKSSISRST
jgi:hypothetical protein